MSPMYMSVLGHAADQGHLVLRHSVRPCVLLPAATMAATEQEGSHEAAIVCGETESVQDNLQQETVAAQEGQDEQHGLVKLSPVRVVFEPSVTSGNGNAAAAAATVTVECATAATLDDATATDNVYDDQNEQLGQRQDGQSEQWHQHNEDKDEMFTGGGHPVAEFDKILLGTGTKADCRALPLIRDLLDNGEAVQIIGGFPVLSTDLQWGSLPVFVLGALAGLQLGPGALNLMGARQGADIVATKLEDAEVDLQGGNRVHNVFAALAGDSDSDSAEENSSSSETENDVRSEVTKQPSGKPRSPKSSQKKKKKKKIRRAGRRSR